MKGIQWVRLLAAFVLVFAATTVFAGDGTATLRPIWGQVTGEVSFPASDACLDITGAPFQTVTEAEGRMTHLGRTEVSLSHCATADGQAVAGAARFTAANGDEIWASYSAHTVAPPPMIVQEAEFIITGGTGRFAAASGRLRATVYVTFEGMEDPSWPIALVFAGTIAY